MKNIRAINPIEKWAKNSKEITLFIFGEIHTSEERRRIEKQIDDLYRANRLDFILAEELGPFRYLNKSEIEKGRLAMQDAVGEDIFKLGLKYEIPVIGIDLWDDDVYKNDVYYPNSPYAKDVKRSFRLREAQMVKVIKEWLPMGNGAVICGDTHLRTVSSMEDIGPVSPVWTTFKNNPQVEFIRSPNGEIK